MASLSNINGLFDVHSTGAILFSTSHGTSGQILKSNGNAAPTWVTASTVIGGPYLPLTGGTLSGATATASGISFTVGGALTGTSAIFSGTITAQANNNTFGTASASGRPLTVQGNSSGQTIRLKNTLGGDGTISATGTANTMNYSFGTFSTNALFIQNDGKIGIGTDSPASVLHIKDNSASPTQLSIQSNDFTRAEEINFLNPSTSAISGQIKYYTNPTVEYMSFSTSNNSATVERMRIANTLITFPTVTELRGDIGSNKFAIGNMGDGSSQMMVSSRGFITFNTSNTGSALDATERMRITSGGNVGIGTTSPAHKLNVVAPNNTTAVGIDFPSAHFDFSANSTSGYTTSFHMDNTGTYIGSNSAGRALIFQTNDTDRLYINGNTGNVGIGTTSPGRGLTIDKSNANAALEIIKNNTTNQIVYLGTGSSAGTDDPLLRMYHNGTENIRLYATGDSWINGGKVGIGTVSPQRPLHVDGTEGVARFTSTASGNNGFEVGIGTASQAFLWQSESQFMQFATANTERMRITSAGELYIGHTSTNPANGLTVVDPSTGTYIQLDHINGTASGSIFSLFRYNQSVIGSITQNGTSQVSFNISSDYRLKEDLQDFAGLDMVSKIPVYYFKWKTDESRSYGVMAHELQEVLPDAVVGKKDAKEMQGVDYSKIVPLLVKSIQELETRIKELENK